MVSSHFLLTNFFSFVSKDPLYSFDLLVYVTDIVIASNNDVVLTYSKQFLAT